MGRNSRRLRTKIILFYFTPIPSDTIMREFLRTIKQYILPYKKYMVGALVFNLLSAVLNVFSFISLIPMLQLLFGIDKHKYSFMAWNTPGISIKDITVNNLYYYTTELMSHYGASVTLLLIGLFLIVTTLQLLLCFGRNYGAYPYGNRTRLSSGHLS